MSQSQLSQAVRGRRKKRSEEDDDDEDAEEVQNSQKKAKKSKDSEVLHDKQKMDKLVGDLMRYILFMDHSKTPVKREDMNKTVLQEHKNITKTAISQAQKKFMEIFGFDLVELPKKASAKKSAVKTGSGVYILKNTVDQQLIDWPKDDVNFMGLLMVILSMIYLSNGVIDQEALYDQLKRLGLREGEKHPVFDEWEKLLEGKFTKEMYLDRKKNDRVAANGKMSFDYHMGPRAMVEIDKRDILQFISLMYGEDSVDPALLRQLELENEQIEDSSEDEGEEPSQSQASQTQASQSQASQSQVPQRTYQRRNQVEEQAEQQLQRRGRGRPRTRANSDSE